MADECVGVRAAPARRSCRVTPAGRGTPHAGGISKSAVLPVRPGTPSPLSRDLLRTPRRLDRHLELAGISGHQLRRWYSPGRSCWPALLNRARLSCVARKVCPRLLSSSAWTALTTLLRPLRL